MMMTQTLHLMQRLDPRVRLLVDDPEDLSRNGNLVIYTDDSYSYKDYGGNFSRGDIVLHAKVRHLGPRVDWLTFLKMNEDQVIMFFKLWKETTPDW